ncbi:MAG: hypothetical protein KJ999_05990 [Gammaproteobacteria bacterium]|nr:hypothetical protein [Gammaproteobacteria bacterium]MBU2199681.1 hypothetical protein [Gammaproteobacteria bacterium]
MPNLPQITDKFLQQNKLFVEAGRRLLTTCEHRVLFPCDELMASMLNRASWQLCGLLALIEQKNFLVAAALVRLQLDNVLRFNGVMRHNDPHGVALQLRQGEELWKIKGVDGLPMNDANLKKLLDDQWFNEIYKRSSDYVHFSNRHVDHFFYMADRNEDGSSSFFIGPPRDYIPPEAFDEIATIFLEIGEKTLECAEQWIAGREALGTAADLSKRFPHAGPQ